MRGTTGEQPEIWKVLVTDPLAQEGIALLEAEPDIQVEINTNLDAQGLLSAIGDCQALIVRSQTKVTEEVIRAGKHLKVIARAGVGVDNIDVEAATRQGIMVVNSPEGNTIAAAEHTIALLLALSRNLPQGHASLKAGEWERKRFTGVEVHNKVLGILGLGKIGAEVARRAQGLGMQVIAYDPLISEERARQVRVELMDLEQLLKAADYITTHTPLSKETHHLIGEKELDLAKPGVRIINCARGGIVDEAALAEAIEAGKVAGAAFDVFESEPPTDSPLLKLDQVIATPHLGASTKEAQVKVAVDVAEQVVAVLRGKPARSPVNAPA